jgi:hypothetical protein
LRFSRRWLWKMPSSGMWCRVDEAIRSSETSVHIGSTRRHIPEDGVLRLSFVSPQQFAIHSIRSYCNLKWDTTASPYRNVNWWCKKYNFNFKAQNYQRWGLSLVWKTCFEWNFCSSTRALYRNTANISILLLYNKTIEVKQKQCQFHYCNHT